TKKRKVEEVEEEVELNGDTETEKVKKTPKAKKTKATNGSPKKKAKKVKTEVSEESEEAEETPVKKTKKGRNAKGEPAVNGAVVNGAKAAVNGTKAAVNGEAEEKDVEVSEAAMKGAFENFNISAETVEKLKGKLLFSPFLFPIQAQTFDIIMEGVDCIGRARTGTGKTFAFAIPVVEMLNKKPAPTARGAPRVLVMLPVRELAIQVAGNFKSLASRNLAVVCVYGGEPIYTQISALRRGVDVVVGTPGRIMDMIKRNELDLSKLEHVVLDEVDRMLDMGFAENVDEILQTRYNENDVESNPQTLLFSATMPDWVQKTSQKYMKKNTRNIDLVGRERVRTSITVQHLALQCNYQDRAATVGDVLRVYSGSQGRAMVFCETKRDADDLAVSPCIGIETHVLHGDIPQEKRQLVLQKFREGRYKCLITTDVAARGLDIPEVDLVVQCCPPKDVDSYIHRSGRTGRAGRQGTCVLFYKYGSEYEVQRVERTAGFKFRRVGAPSRNEIIDAAARDARLVLATVPEETLGHFRESAKLLIEEKGGVDAVAAALAVITGNTEMKSRSLLTSKEGFTTYVFTSTNEIKSMGYFWSAMERQLPSEIKDKVRAPRMQKDQMGCVFDLPSDVDALVENYWQDSEYHTLNVATELPEMEDAPVRSGYGGGGYGGGGGGYGGGRGGFRGRGFSQGRGRFNSRGGGGGRGRGGSRGGRGRQ
ncbi:hypothetical protein CAPTEDRAFT_52524, partial [Capitella teleta]